jgi:hypothetical protein
MNTPEEAPEEIAEPVKAARQGATLQLDLDKSNYTE